ncbi:MAG: hypothetical protein CME65_02825 [Halobacteriovoraceae bacterium]|nr:hypothetical protein [Halobacteriovoraceae bacterium]|tara:strand:- start:2449 stop:3543 length:1095 start_codon:yes stop_codon:yes gene_type:complete
MKTFVITGTTGFLGSSLAQELLKDGHQVFALARGEGARERVENSVQSAAIGFGTDINFERLKVFDSESKQLESELKSQSTDEVHFIHSAAEMSYAWKKMGKSLSFNVSQSIALLELAKSLEALSFNYISTLYFSQNEGLIDENICLQNHPQNSYQASKWLAETKISLIAEKLEIPYRVFRPGIIIGHSQTGWCRLKSFGFYMFLEGFHRLNDLGVKKLNLDLDPSSKLALICIDDVVDWICHYVKMPEFGFFNLTYSQLENAKIENLRRLIENSIPLKIRFSKPRSLSDFVLDREVKKNKDFANRHYQFSTEKLDRDFPQRRSLDNSSLINVIEFYHQNRESLSRLKYFKKQCKRQVSIWANKL